MSYSFFADYYDLLTQNVNYAGYAKRIDTLIKKYRPGTETVLDAACGTASLSLELVRLGYTVVGADLSEQMILSAQQKKQSLGIQDSKLTLFVQDIRRLALKKCEAAVCSLDALNHLGGLSDIKRCFLSVREHLLSDGIFIFDMNTPYKHKNILADNCFVYDRKPVMAVWQNEFLNDGDYTVDMTLDFFVNDGDRYIRRRECIREKAYRRGLIRASLKICGFEPIAEFDQIKDRPPRYDTERILYVARRK